MTRLGFTGDVMLGRLVDERQRRRPAAAVWGDVLDRLRALDGLFVNLECCLSTRGGPWTETYRPFHFRADPDRAVSALERAGVDWANLANNHLMDFGETALLDTVRRLDEAGIAHSGAGRNLRAAREPAVVDVGDPEAAGLRVGFVSATDNTPEFAATEANLGTAYLDLRDESAAREVLAAQLARARERDPDLLVASLHWGPNMVEEPPERFRRLARWLVEQGIDVVHGHSAHVFQGVEVRDGSVILYDCGDFVDDYAVDSTLRNDRSFLFEMSVEEDGVTSLRLLPTEISNLAVHQTSPSTAEWSRRRMRALSAPFGTEFERDGEVLVVQP
ncbi:MULTISPECIES: CapA family protein [Halorussus]|uniref:CapA family protein n=1 Tax=Halorussus TaxID=1070314 RepID=UPI00209E976A|nr:CapA family protein [Halorussus vallis]USZ74021.1 CapA family protein [Halorussus vallis]